MRDRYTQPDLNDTNTKVPSLQQLILVACLVAVAVAVPVDQYHKPHYKPVSAQ